MHTGLDSITEIPRLPSNVEKIVAYLEYGNPLKQAFVIEAVSRYADTLLKDMEKTRREMRGSFISPNAWLDCAQTWRDQVQPK